MKKSKFLLHTCCAVCGGWIIQELNKVFDLSVYFYNPNIYPKEECDKRKKAIEEYCKKNSVNFLEGEYDNLNWFEKVKGLENEPEGGKRCEVCYSMRLSDAAKKAKSLGCEYFGATLSISPYKNSEIINRIGKQAGAEAGVIFYEADWKKNNGFQNAQEVRRQEGFYSQNYCGCIYSMRKK